MATHYISKMYALIVIGAGDFLDNPGTVVIDDNLTVEIGDKWNYFIKEDTFNPGVIVEGWINRKPTFYYGALYITSVNGVPCKQFIPCTPKMHYPYNMEGKFSWPEDIENIDIYAKLDGSNIFQMVYHDDKGKEYVSYKTRLLPFVDPGSKYSMYGLWCEILKKYPGIKELPFMLKTLFGKPIGISYEMYGRKNLILLRYKELLDCRIIFVRELDGERRILPPPEVLSEGIPPKCEMITNINPNSNLEEEYWKVKDWLDTKLTVKCEKCEKEKVKVLAFDSNGKEREILVCKKCTPCNNGVNISDIELTSDLVEGLEGCILYANGRNGYVQFKVKPQYVLDIHMKASEGIPTHAILITVKNAFEETEDVTTEHIAKLLEEEFTVENIQRKMNTIANILHKVRADRIIKHKIYPMYDEMHSKDSSFDLSIDKGKVMRYFASKLEEIGLTKKDSGRIFSLLHEFYVEE